MVSNRIKNLRTQMNMTQTELARKLGITRSSVNAWEMGISVPSTQYIIELASIFHVSTDFLLGLNKSATIDVSFLSDEDIEILVSLANHLQKKRNGE